MKVELTPAPHWFHDLCSCLQDCIGTVLLHHGQDPTLTLGAAWDFYYLPSQFHPEEYFYPQRQPTLAQSIAPYHPISSQWHRAPDAESGWQAVRAAVAAGAPAIVAVDNFYLPFRPAYQDIHAGHLVVVYGFDDEAEQVYVLDSTPPVFKGPISIQALKDARSSANPVDDRDDFFSSTPVANRWLQLTLDSPFPALTRAWVVETLAANLRRFHEPGDGPGFSGLDGLRRYLATLCERCTRQEGRRDLAELYAAGWAFQAATALHADFLMQVGQELGWPRLAQIGRQVDRLAHHWTALRMMGGHYRERPTEIAARLERRAQQLLADQQLVLRELERALRAPDAQIMGGAER
jgi:hypothetical protein